MIPKTMKRGVAILMLFLFILTPLKASAHESYFLQVLIDTKTYSYTSAVHNDDSSAFLGRESEHIEAKFGDFRNLIGNEYIVLPSGNLGDVLKPNGAEDKVIMPFTFPPIEAGDGWFDGVPTNDGDQDDANRAYTIKDTLTGGLNDAMFVLHDGKSYDNIEDFMKASVNLSKAISDSVKSGGVVSVPETNGYTLQVGVRAKSSQGDPDDKDRGISNKDYLVISDGSTEYEYVYRMQKGYAGNSPTLDSNFQWKNKVWDSRYQKTRDDIGYITWNAMMYQGFYALVAMNLDAKDGGQVAHVGPLEEAVRWMLESIFNGIRNLLGLYSMNELIYNDGIRGSKVWYYGIMPDAWENNVMLYHWIFQAFAWSLISFSIVKLLISRNLSTINPSSRVSLIEGVKDLMITGVLLSFIMPLLNMFFMLNSRIVDVFAAVGPDLDKMTGLNEFTGFLAGVLLQFFYLIILIWLNFTYIVRSITIAVLTVLSPIFVVTLSLGGKWKGLFMNWLKEMVSNIFLQSFHAFLIGFLYLSQMSSRGIELAVICFAMIPLTEFFRGMITGQAGGITSSLGLGSVTALGGAAGSAMKNAKNSIGASRVKGGASGTGEGSGSMSSISDVANSGLRPVKSNISGGDIKTGSSEKLKQNQATAMAQNRTKYQDTRNAQMEKQIPLDIAQKGKDSDEYQRFMGGAQPYSEHEAKVMDFKENLKNDYLSKDAVKNTGMSALKTAGKIALGGAGVGLGVGYALALGGVDSNAARDGLKLAGRSAKFMSKGAGAGAAKIYGDLKTGYQLTRDGIKNGAVFGAGSPIKASSTGAQLPGVTRTLPGGRTVGATTGTSSAGVGGSTGSGGAIVPAGSGSSNTNIPPGSDLSGAMYSHSIGKGNSEVYRDGQVLSEQGILRANEDDNGNAVFVYDQNKFGVSRDGNGNEVYTQDYHNLKTYQSTFLNGTQEQKDHLRSSGIENVAMTGDGNLAVVYNQAGKEAMGFKNVRMSGGNMIETKSADQPLATKASVTVPQSSGLSQSHSMRSNTNQQSNQQSNHQHNQHTRSSNRSRANVHNDGGIVINGGVYQGNVNNVVKSSSKNSNQTSDRNNSHTINTQSVKINNGVQINGGNFHGNVTNK